MDFLNFLIYNNYFPNEQDPTSHRIKEKRRRDRMNDSLAELSRLIPANYVKQVKLKRLRLSTYTEMVKFYFSDICQDINDITSDICRDNEVISCWNSPKGVCFIESSLI